MPLRSPPPPHPAHICRELAGGWLTVVVVMVSAVAGSRSCPQSAWALRPMRAPLPPRTRGRGGDGDFLFLQKNAWRAYIQRAPSISCDNQWSSLSPSTHIPKLAQHTPKRVGVFLIASRRPPLARDLPLFYPALTRPSRSLIGVANESKHRQECTLLACAPPMARARQQRGLRLWSHPASSSCSPSSCSGGER